VPDESIREWSELEGAVSRQDWAEASKLAEEFEREWKTVRGIAEVFVGPGSDGWSRALDEALEALVASLSIRPIPRVAVDAAMTWLGEILDEHGTK